MVPPPIKADANSARNRNLAGVQGKLADAERRLNEAYAKNEAASESPAVTPNPLKLAAAKNALAVAERKTKLTGKARAERIAAIDKRIAEVQAELEAAHQPHMDASRVPQLSGDRNEPYVTGMEPKFHARVMRFEEHPLDPAD